MRSCDESLHTCTIFSDKTGVRGGTRRGSVHADVLSFVVPMLLVVVVVVALLVLLLLRLLRARR